MLITKKKTENVLIINATYGGKQCNIAVKNGKISAIYYGEIMPKERFDEIIDAKGKIIVPGLIDVHCHGCMGKELTDGEQALNEMSLAWAKQGTTSWYPTNCTIPVSVIQTSTSSIPKTDGANIVGYHSEGPYINVKYKGAQDPNCIVRPNLDDFSDNDNVKLITLAPEVDGAIEYIKGSKALVVVGHTNATYDEACAGFKAGAKCVTHLFNAMPPLHHREPSVLGAAYDCGAYVQIICDGMHIHPSVIRLTYKLFSSKRMILISDAIRPALLADGEYDSGGLAVTVKNGKATLKGTDTLAGATTSLYGCVQKAIEFGIPPKDAYKMASTTPAEMMGIKKGKIKKGYDAEFLLLDSDWKMQDVLILNK
jgi:N-acetylglucosamine-6-phosphate deacetylase